MTYPHFFHHAFQVLTKRRRRILSLRTFLAPILGGHELVV